MLFITDFLGSIDDVLIVIVQGSWKQSLRNSFKNFRRDHPTDENESPLSRKKGLCPPKRLKPTEKVLEYIVRKITRKQLVC